MKKFELNLTEYSVTVKVNDNGKMVDKTEIYPLKDNISNYLRAPGVFDTGEEIAEAIGVAKQILDCKEDTIELDKREAEVLKRGINKHIAAAAAGNGSLGGVIHEELILRVFGIKEV